MLTIPLVVAPVVAEPTTPIKPSEALRLGRLLRPVRIEGSYFRGKTGACALGAISTGYGYPVRLAELALPRGIAGRIVHNNDDNHWSDDQIVAWLESLGL